MNGGIIISKLIRRISFVVVLVILIPGMMITVFDVHGATSFNGYVKDENGNPINGASIILYDCYENIMGFTLTNSAGYYGFSAYLNGNSPYSLYAGKEGYETKTIVVTSGGSYNFELEKFEKIAVFFWASDAGTQAAIDGHIDVLENLGYTKFFEYRNQGDVYGALCEIDTYEKYFDTIFVYIIGHGFYTEVDDYSTTKFKPNGAETKSFEFRNYINNYWEAERRCILVESCESRGWADDFAETPYLAMSTSDEDHSSYCYGGDPPGEGKFSHYFFYAIGSLQKNAVQAFNYACIYTSNQNPQIRDYSTYVWFN